jgi:hypothetical protein
MTRYLDQKALRALNEKAPTKFAKRIDITIGHTKNSNWYVKGQPWVC